MDLITIASLSAVIIAQDAQPAKRSEAERIARDYMAAYSQVDLERMQSFLADDAVFEDRTALGEGVGPDGLSYDNSASVMEMLNQFRATYNPIELGFAWDTVFESNGRVIFSGHVNALYPTQDVTQNFRWRAEQVTVITVRDGHVVRHQDFASYANPQREMVPAD
ncbi:nuclear transport factor 2 family protein [Maricaulis sp.]|uniref:nuclear transport factor 2 family protein n=1 Tax=Maricaulis sp. TaxID=1486257 RepID=UPI001B2C22CC|nr:nuclear transport factor 2 family protein [Maricaulis sp.]MBO6795679.1 nuclear transport factor 2 family protein [Maricaulis sp.]